MTERLTDAEAETVRAFAGASVLILGDVMLDEFVWGDVRRISPEAPVPVVECTRRTYAAGGAGNVAANVAGLGGRARLGGAVGADASAESLRVVLTEAGVLPDGLTPDPERPTTTKTRILAHGQQIARVDSERRAPLPESLAVRLLAWAGNALSGAGACVLSDYGKGVVTPETARAFLSAASAQGRPVVVDPKGSDYARYRGATVITPNVAETERATSREIHSDADVLAAGSDLLALLPGTAILVTRGADGMSLLREGHAPVHIPTVARSVYDVTGAGDTVVSALALALAVGAPLEHAARLANRAAGVVVGKLGTARVSLDELIGGEETGKLGN